ncbi:hypothetical protein [Amycolatopsis sp. cmx-4-54]|uniref:hypothetical protein n=1 Tax=Amycolatopsis sp. cmx-4-54 TaxID=2790936 RepID=UPI00397CF952
MRQSLPSRWQLEVIVYGECDPYPILLLQPSNHHDHRALSALLAAAGMKTPSPWEWEYGLWPLAAGCSVELTESPPSVSMVVGGDRLSVGTGTFDAPAAWVRAARRQRRVLFALVPARWSASDAQVVDHDVTVLGTRIGRHACLVGIMPLNP